MIDDFSLSIMLARVETALIVLTSGPGRPITLDQKRVQISSLKLQALRGSRQLLAFRPAPRPSLCRIGEIYMTSSKLLLLSGNRTVYNRFAFHASKFRKKL